ncbi:MAG TPA: HD domain-containing protein [Candidatus Saccharimonadales bacterium]|nr:HD domain-containing protein [Candidatus Saccharimonadales bacterium]
MKKDRNEDIDISVPSKYNPLIEQALQNINSNIEIKTMWKIINVNAIDRLGMSDHGPIHFQIVSNIALKLFRLLIKNGVEPAIVRDFELTENHAELVILLASLFHDLGMTISRDGHEEFSLFLAKDYIKQVLDFLPIEERTIVSSETLHAIIGHRSDGEPLTMEAGIVRVADALDMSHGRARIAYEIGNVDIYSLSVSAIEGVEINAGTKKPIDIEITMNNSSGLFQVDELLKKKLKGSGIEKYVGVRAIIAGETEKKLLKEFVID